MLFSHNHKTPDKPYLHLLNDVNFTPVFIQGNPRSGTTLLYNLLARTECFNFVTAYHVINYDEILFNHLNLKENQAKEGLNRHLETLGIRSRMFDEIEVSSDMPEEYGFVLKNSGYWYKLSSKSLARFMEMCKKVQYISGRHSQLLLKSPLDFPNFMFLKSTFPGAKFVFIHRNPIHMINSLLKAVRHSLASVNPVYALIIKDYAKLFNQPMRLFLYRFIVSSHFSLGLRILTRYYASTFKYFLKNIGSLPESDYISFRYEDLCDEPEVNMVKIEEFLGIEPSVSLNYREAIKPRRVELLEEVKRKQGSILDRFEDYLTYCGYDKVTL